MDTIEIDSKKREELIDITNQVNKIISDSGTKQGICVIQTLHTTAAITINENADPDVKSDIIKGLKIFDKNDYQHGEGNSPAHIKSSLVGASKTVIINNGNLQLGTWQSVFFVELDGPRKRKAVVKIIENGSM